MHLYCTEIWLQHVPAEMCHRHTEFTKKDQCNYRIFEFNENSFYNNGMIVRDLWSNIALSHK